MNATEIIAFAAGIVPGAFVGIVIGAMVLDAYHERQRAELETVANDSIRERMDTANQLAVVRTELARSESLVETLSREIATLRAQRSHAESLHAERIRNALESARWN